MLKYWIVTGVILILSATALLLLLMMHRQRKWARSIVVHVLFVLVMSGIILTLQQLAYMLCAAYNITFITSDMINMAALFAIAFMVMRQLFQLINRLTLSHIDKGNDPTSARMVSRILKLTIFMFMVLIFGEHFGIGLSGLLAFGGIGGIAIGVAGKDMLSNLFSGVMLYFDRPFNIGDWVRSPDRQIEGTVVEIGWRITKIMTFDNRPLYVPNAIFSMISVENPGRMTNRHITTTLGLRYEDAAQIGAIIADIRAMLAANKKIDQTQDQLVYFNAFADSSLNIMIDCFTVTTKWAAWLEAQQEVYLNMIAIVQKHGADFAYPTQTLLVNNQQPDISNTSATVK